MGFFDDLLNVAEPAVKNAVSDAVKDALDKNKTPLPAGVQTMAPQPVLVGQKIDSLTISLVVAVGAVLGAMLILKKKAK